MVRNAMTALVMLLALFAAPPDFSTAAARGKQFKSRQEFLEKGLKDQKFKISGAFSKDSISKYVTLFDDDDVIAAAVAESNQRMITLSDADLAAIPRTGLLFANVEVHARGLIPVKRMHKRYLDGKAHLVLKFGDTVVQPVKAGAYPSPPKTECHNEMYIWSVFGSWNWSVGGMVPISLPCGQMAPGKIAVEFAFDLTPAQRSSRAELILIDGEGRRFSTDVDLGRIGRQ